MSLERVTNYLKQFGVEDKIKIFDKSSTTVELAALAIGCTQAEIAKTLSFRVKEEVILIVTAGDTRIDNKKYKAKFGCKAKMLTFEEVPEFIGHEVGGVCPFGAKDDVVIYLDESLKRFDKVFPACGSSNSAIEVSIKELEEYTKFAEWIEVFKLNDIV